MVTFTSRFVVLLLVICVISYPSEGKNYTAEFSTPEGTGPFPLVIISHGSGGVHPGLTTWSNHFKKIGFATIIMNHYGPRGWSKGKEPPKGQEATEWRANDLVDILKEVVSNELVDKTRIVLAGFSAGAALTMTGLENKSLYTETGLLHPIKAGILFYPYMYACDVFDFTKISFPIIHLHGSKDETYEHCWKKNIKKMESDKHPLVSKIYAGAYHLFDAPHMKKKKCRRVRAANDAPYPSYELCIKFNQDAYSNSRSDLKDFLMEYGIK
jgi:dienelactone hydrolase